jgi:hypothetical protein
MGKHDRDGVYKMDGVMDKHDVCKKDGVDG